MTIAESTDRRTLENDDSTTINDIENPEMLFTNAKIGGRPAMWKAEMLSYAQKLLANFKNPDQPEVVNAHLVVVSVFKGVTDQIINCLHELLQEHDRNGRTKFTEAMISEVFSQPGGPRDTIRGHIDRLFADDDLLKEFIGGDNQEMMSVAIAAAREAAINWEEQVFQQRVIQMATAARVLDSLHQQTKAEAFEISEKSLNNLMIGYGEDVVVGVYQQLFNLNSQIYAKAMPYYTDANNNHANRYEAAELALDNAKLGPEFFNRVIDQSRAEFDREMEIIMTADELEGVRRGTRMTLFLRSGFTGNVNETKRSYSDVRSALEAVMLAIYKNGSENQKELLFLLMKELSEEHPYLLSTDPRTLTDNEYDGLKAEIQAVRRISLARTARIALANGNNTPVAATVCQILQHYLSHMNGKYSIPVKMEMRDIRRPDRPGTEFTLGETAESEQVTLLSTIAVEKNVSVKVTHSASSEHKGFLADVNGLFSEHDLSIYTNMADSDSIQIGVILSDNETQRARQLERFEQVVGILKERYSRHSIDLGSNVNGGNDAVVEAYDKATRLTLVGYEVETNYQQVMKMIYTLFPDFGYKVRSAAQLTDPKSLTFEVEWMGEGQPPLNASEIAHIYFVEKKARIATMVAGERFMERYWEGREAGKSWEKQCLENRIVKSSN